MPIWKKLMSGMNSMKWNHSKYQAITFQRVERNPVLTCEGTVIPIQGEMEPIGITINNKLKFEEQIRKICGKVSQQIAVLNRLKKILSFELRLDIYQAFIAPYFDYCSESQHHCGKRGCPKLEKTSPSLCDQWQVNYALPDQLRAANNIGT